MTNKKELDLSALDQVAGGSKQETWEAVTFIDSHFPDVRVGNSKELRRFLESIGISKVSSNSTGANKYYDTEGNLLTHEQFMQLLKDAAGTK